MENYLEKTFDVDSLHVDFKKEYDLCGLLRHFHEVSEQHSCELGIDANTVLDKYNAIWIITRIRVDVDFMPEWQQQIAVETYPLLPGLVRMEREAVFLRGGVNFARLSSEWCLIDSVNGRPRRPARTGYPMDMAHRGERVTDDFSRFAPQFDETDLAFAHTVRVGDLDMNVHMNNVAYVRLACDAFSAKELSERRVRSFEIAFKSQSFEGEEIRVYRKPAGENEYYVSGVKPNGDRVFDTLFCFA